MPTLMSRSLIRMVESPPAAASVSRVLMRPNATALTVTFERPHSFARVFVSPMTPALPAA